MSDLRALEAELNTMTKAGKILEALEIFYAEDCTFQEGNQPPRRGRKAQHDHLSAFFATLKSFNGATLHSSCIGDSAATAEWTFDMTGPNGPILWNEVLARRWRNGKVVSERYYTAP
ncbi:MAG: nuclear transport factor 2 family protein [Phycisphaerales bacterium]